MYLHVFTAKENEPSSIIIIAIIFKSLLRGCMLVTTNIIHLIEECEMRMRIIKGGECALIEECRLLRRKKENDEEKIQK